MEHIGMYHHLVKLQPSLWANLDKVSPLLHRQPQSATIHLKLPFWGQFLFLLSTSSNVGKRMDCCCYEVVYLRVKKAFSVSPVQAVATARTKVVRPKALWIGTRLALKAAVADSQQSRSKKLKKPAMN